MPKKNTSTSLKSSIGLMVLGHCSLRLLDKNDHTVKDAMPVSSRSEMFSSYILKSPEHSLGINMGENLNYP